MPKKFEKSKSDVLKVESNAVALESETGSTSMPPSFQLVSSTEQEKEGQSKNQSSSKSSLPFQLQDGIEAMSGMSMDDVNVNYNSSKPAQLNAKAYAQGSDIHLGPGQEQHLPHEAWHVVQQKQNRVKPTTTVGGAQVNDSPGLEHEADTMGTKAAQLKVNPNKGNGLENKNADGATQLKKKGKTVKLPEKLGPTQEGDIANKGPGDAHAFSPNDVNQGSIGDCYFLSSLIAVANNSPNLLKKNIKKNKDGTYTVKLFRKEAKSFLFFSWDKFIPVYIKLYPTFPIAADAVDHANPDAASNPAHAHGGDTNKGGQTELWVRLFEKAYAIMLGSYKTLGSGGFGANALEAITGKPYEEQVLDDDSHERIQEMVAEGIPVNVGTSKHQWKSMSKKDKKFARENDIVAGHSYAVMSANKSGLTVRNPWGEGASNAEVTLTWRQFDAMFNQFANRQ